MDVSYITLTCTVQLCPVLPHIGLLSSINFLSSSTEEILPGKNHLHIHALKIEQATDLSISQMVESWKLIWILDLKEKQDILSLWFLDRLYCLHCCSDPSNCICYALLWCIKKRQLIPPVLFAKQRRYDSCRTIIAAGAAADPILHYLLIIYNIYYNNALLVNDLQYLLQ